MRRLAAGFMALCLAVSALASAETAPEAALRDALKGAVAPLSLTAKQLDATWVTFIPSGVWDASRLVSMLASEGQGLAYYTTGQTVSLQGETYLVAYRRERSEDDNEHYPPGDEPPLTPETKLCLSLLNLQQMGHLGDIRAFDPQTLVEKPSRRDAELKESVDNLKRLGLAVAMYSQDYDETMPPLATPGTARRALEPYVKSTAVFTQPGVDRPYRTNPLLSGRKMAHISNPAEMIVFFEAEPAPDGTIGAVYMDGHARRLPWYEWPMACRKSRLVPGGPPEAPSPMPARP